MILFVDPGKQVGWATWRNDGSFIRKEEGPYGDFYSYLEVLMEMNGPHTFGCEDYVLDPNISQGGSKMEACRVLGAVEFAARITGSKFVLQKNLVLTSAQRMSGVEVPKHGRKDHDANSAYNHGIFWLVKNNIIENPAHKRIVRTSGN